MCEFEFDDIHNKSVTRDDKRKQAARISPVPRKIYQFRFILTLVCAILCSFSVLEAHLISVTVESVRKNSVILISSLAPDNDEYSVYIDGKPGVTLHILSVQSLTRSEKKLYRIEAVANREFRFHSGEALSLTASSKSYPPAYKDSFGRDRENYLSQITAGDNRDMVLVPKGTALIGSNHRGADSFPEHTVELDSFYIDKYEVSNRDYLVYVKQANADTPLSWENDEFPQDLADYPVIVTYAEAEAYAKWAGKRLPTEFEWEKAANGVITPIRVITEMGIEYKAVKTAFPWGDDYSFQGTNSLEFWQGRSSYGKSVKGLLPVNEFSDVNRSAYGAINMSGNAAEWTSSWYAAYKGNRTPNRRFGRQVKTIRGGSFTNSIDKQTTFARAYGGLPSLSRDSAAGFRCVKTPDPADMRTDAREAMP